MNPSNRTAEDVDCAHLADLHERVAALEARVAVLESQGSIDRLRAEHEEQRPRLSYVAETLMEKTDVPGGVRVSCPGCVAQKFFRPDVVPVVLHGDVTCPVLLRIREAEDVSFEIKDVRA
jgi:hypothetical protein